jgi:phosphopantothenoylcysteine decarboxylase/phosphopantothenate--cysteine ligase
VTLVSGPTQLPDPPGVTTVRIESAEEMLAACNHALPVDVAICAAAVADWKVAERAPGKIKKQQGTAPPALELAENPDILRTLSARGKARPQLVIGFAAETDRVVERAVAKRQSKGCDWMLANDVAEGTGTFGGDDNAIHFVTADGVEDWPRQTKRAVAETLARRVAAHLGAASHDEAAE